MKEIKCRAWDKANKKYIYSETELRFARYSAGCEHHSKVGFIGYSSCEHFEFEEYINLKTPTGIELYEGDIVTWNVYEKNKIISSDTGQIIFNEESAIYSLKGWGRFMLDSLEDLEVIGNVHEDAELLND